MNSPDNDDSDGRWWQTIRGRLYLSFAVVLALAVIPAVVAMQNFTRSAAEIDKVVTGNVPVLRQSNAFATIAGRVLTHVGLLIQAVDQAERVNNARMISNNLSAFSGMIDALPPGVPEATKIQLSQLRNSLKWESENLAELIGQRLRTINDGRSIFSRINGELDKFEGSLETIKKDAGFDLSLALVDLASGRLTDKEDINQLINEDFANFQFVSEMELATVQLRADLLKLIEAESLRQIDTLEASFAAHMETMTRNLNGINFTGDVDAEIKQLATISAAAVGEKGLFATIRQQLTVNEDIQLAQFSVQSTAQRFRDFSVRFTGRVVDEAALVVTDVQDSVTRSRWTVIQLAFVSVLGVVAVIVFLVTPQIVRPIMATSKAMRQIAGGNADATLPNAKGGEIGRMIASLSQLKDYVTRVVDAERETQEKEAELRLALDNMPGGMILTDKNLVIRLLNTEFSSFVGLPEGFLQPGDSHEKLLRYMAENGYYGDNIDVDEAVAERLESVLHPSGEVYYDHLPNGRVNAVRRRKTPDGDVVTIVTDVTEQLKSQETAARLQEAMDVFTDSIILYDKDEKVVFTNERYHEFYPNSPPKGEIVGSTQKDLLQRTLEMGLIEDPLAKSDPEAWIQKKLEERRANPNFESETKRTDGKTLLIRHQPTDDDGLIISHTDITERKRMEETVRRSEQQLLNMLEESPIAVAISIDDQSDDDGEIVFTNPRFREMLGYPPAKLVGARTTDFMPLDERRDEHERALEEGAALVDLEVEINRQDNAKIWTLMTIHPIQHEGRKAALIWLYDISERKQWEAEIARQSSILESTLEAMEQGISMFDRDLNLIARNEKFMEMLELPEDRFGGDSVNLSDMLRYNAERGEYGDGDIDAQIAERIALAMEFEAHKFERTRPDGTVIEVRGNPLPDKSGFVTTYTDITERKQAEQAIAAKEAQLRLAMDNMPGAMIVVDSDLRVVLVNDTYIEYYGNPDGKVKVGTPMVDLLRSEALRGLLGPGKPADIVEHRLDGYVNGEAFNVVDRTEDGRYIQLMRRPAEGGYTISVAIDVTEQKLAEAEIAEKEAEIRLALDNMPGGICMLDSNLCVQVVNDRYCELYGQPREVYAPGTPIRGIIQRNIDAELKARDAYDEDQATRLVRQRISAFRSGVPGDTERILPTGRVLHVRHNPIDGGGVVLVITDITERRRAEQAVETQQEQMTDILNNTQQGIVLWDADKKPIVWNDKFPDALQINEEILQDAEFTIETMARLLAERGNYGEGDPVALAKERVETLWSGSSQAEVSFDSERTFDARSTLTDGGRLVVSYTDITERKRSEEIINLERTRLADAIESLDAAFAMFDSEEKLVIFNTKYRGLFSDIGDKIQPGMQFEEMARMACESGGYHLKQATTVDEWVARRVAAQREQKVGMLSQVDDRWYILSHFPTSDGGVVSVRYDVTDLKRTERELANKEAMLTAALENMTGGLFMVDANLQLRVFNERLTEYYELPAGMMSIGAPLSDVIRVRAKRGDYGEGDIDDLVSSRIRGYAQRSVQIVMDRVGDRSIEVYRAPMDDGGMVCVFNDVTERKRAEDELNRAHSLITESLGYASRIQRSLLPPRTILDEVFEDHAIIWEPKDMVGGDMVWLRPAEGGVYLIVADCTGHGPPGAFMTMICTGALDQALAEMDEPDPADVLQRMNTKIKAALGQDGDEGESDDGVELGVCHLDEKLKQVTFAGARFALAVVEDQQIDEIKGNKSAIGYRHVPNDIQFDNHTVKLKKGMRFYLWTDGIVDQIGGPRRRSFGKRRIRNLILDYHQMDMAWQRSQILREFEEYQHAEARRDDITFVGFSL